MCYYIYMFYEEQTSVWIYHSKIITFVEDDFTSFTSFTSFLQVKRSKNAKYIFLTIKLAFILYKIFQTLSVIRSEWKHTKPFSRVFIHILKNLRFKFKKSVIVIYINWSLKMNHRESGVHDKSLECLTVFFYAQKF